MPASFRAHEEQVRDIGAGNQQEDTDAPQQDPQDLAHVADDVFFEWPHGRLKMESVHAMPRISFQKDRQHAADIGVCLRYGYSRFEPTQRLITIIRRRLHKVDTPGDDQIDGSSAESEACGHHADDYAWLGVNGNDAPE